MITEINKDLYLELLEKEVSRLKQEVVFLKVKINALSDTGKPEPEKAATATRRQRKGASLDGVMKTIEQKPEGPEPEGMSEVPFE